MHTALSRRLGTITNRYGKESEALSFSSQQSALLPIRQPKLTSPVSLITEIVAWLLPRLSPSTLSIQNSSSSTPLHWIALNYHLPILQILCPLLPLSAFSIKNKHDKTAVQEAEEACEALVVPEGQEDSDLGKERVKREKVVGYLLGCMGLGVRKPTGGNEAKAEEEVDTKEGEDVVVTSTGAGEKEQELMKKLEKQAERIKLEQDEKK